jgi:hypothetical protein
MLLRNITNLAQYPIRYSAYNATKERSQLGLKQEQILNIYAGEGGIDARNGTPVGYGPPYSWNMPLKGGGLASKITANGEVNYALLAGAKNCAAIINGLGTISKAALQMIVALEALISGSGIISYASITVPMAMGAAVYGSGGVSYANLGTIINMLAHIYGVGSVEANMIGNAFMSSHIYVNEGAASVDQMVAGVWNALAYQYNQSGTLGEKVNAAGTAADPWTTALSGYETEGTAGYVINNLEGDMETVTTAMNALSGITLSGGLSTTQDSTLSTVLKTVKFLKIK